MTPKTPSELKAQVEDENKQPAKEGNERTSEGLSVETPTEGDFFSNLEKVSKPEKS
jgi:hypothetical protein